jgi:hypothetical protein
MVTAIKYFGQKEKVNVPLTPPGAEPYYADYRTELSYLDGVIEVWEDYLDATNPRFKNLFPNIIFQPIPVLVVQQFEVNMEFISKMKGFSVQQKMFLLSTMNFDWKQVWYLDSTSFPTFWDDEANWLFPQNLADIIISFMQNLGNAYTSSPDDTDKILQVLTNSRNSYYDDLKKLKELRSKISLPNSERLKFWLAFEDLALQSYMDTIELMQDYFIYCRDNNSLPAEPFI